MTRHDDTTRLRHMLDHAAEAIEMTQGHSRQDLDANQEYHGQDLRPRP